MSNVIEPYTTRLNGVLQELDILLIERSDEYDFTDILQFLDEISKM